MIEEINQVNEPTYAKNQMDMHWNRKEGYTPNRRDFPPNKVVEQR